MADVMKIAAELLNYDPETGIFTWKMKTGGNGCVKPGTRAGAQRQGGYRFIKINQRYFREHRIAYELIHGAIPAGMEIDHVNGIRDDNRIANLRLATHQENIVNGRHRKNNTSGRKGVTRHVDGRWRARIQVDGKTTHLGLYSSKDEAHAAYMKAMADRFGEFARSA